MSEVTDRSKLHWSTCFVDAFAEVVERRHGIPRTAWSLPEDATDERIPVESNLRLLAGALSATRDPDLGLRAALIARRGDFAPIEYVTMTAPTVREAWKTMIRFIPLVNEASNFSIREKGPITYVRLDSRVPLPRAAADFQAAAIYTSIDRWIPLGTTQFISEIWFEHPEPDRIETYRMVFHDTPIRFSRPFSGFVMKTELLDRALATADPKLHTLLVAHSMSEKERLRRSRSLPERVCELIAAHLTDGQGSADAIARSLSMSRRTLSRQLAQHGTSYRRELDRVRRKLAHEYLVVDGMSASEVGYRLGFSEPAAFHRAFRRWWGENTMSYVRHRPLRKEATS